MTEKRQTRGKLRRLRWLPIALVLVLTPVMIWQHSRYQDFRKGNAQDRQSTFYGANTFHVLWLLELAPGQPLEPSLRRFIAAIEAASGAPIYAGRAAGSTIESNQLGTSAWDAVLLAQFPSREAYDAASLEAVRAPFLHSYAQGISRSVAANLVLPQILLGARLFDIVTMKPSIFPLVPDPGVSVDDARSSRIGTLLEALRADGADGVVFVNLVKNETPEQQAGSSGPHPRKMLRAMAEGGYGPLHTGAAVRIEGDVEFDRVMINYYPSVDFFLSLMTSTFIQETIDSYRPSEMEALPTVPILDEL